MLDVNKFEPVTGDEQAPRKVGFKMEPKCGLQDYHDEASSSTTTYNFKTVTKFPPVCLVNKCENLNELVDEVKFVEEEVGPQENCTETKSDVFSCGPIPFPDSTTKYLLNGVLELLGAPEDIRKSDDLKLSLLTLHPYLAKTLGFLWNITKITTAETEVVKKKCHEMKEQLSANDIKIELLQERYEAIKKIHEEKVEQLENRIKQLKDQQFSSNAYKNVKVSRVDLDIITTNETVRNFFKRQMDSSWNDENIQKKLKETLELFEMRSETIVEAKDNLLETISELERLKSTNNDAEQYYKRYHIMERQYEDFRSTENIYDKLTMSMFKKKKRIVDLKDKVASLERTLKLKDQQIETIQKSYGANLEELAKLSIDDRKRCLGFWDRTQYEATILSKDDTIEQLRFDLRTKNEVIADMENEIYNLNARASQYEKENASLSVKSRTMRANMEELKCSKEQEVLNMKNSYNTTIHELNRVIAQQTKYFNRELQIHKKNCQRSVDEALKVAMKSEITMNVLSTSRRLGTSKLLNYLLNKRRNLKRCFEALKLA